MISAKPLFIRSIPIAASKQALAHSNSYAAPEISLSTVSVRGVAVFVASAEGGGREGGRNESP